MTRTHFRLGLVALLLIAHFFVLTRIQFTVWPEMMLYPWLANYGYTHYIDIIHPYFPGLIWILQMIGSIHLVTWSMILLIDLVLVVLLRRLYGWPVACFGLVWFIVLQPFFEGNGLWFDLATVPFLLASLLFFFEWKRERIRGFLVLTSVFLMFAILIKQSAGLIVLPFMVTTWRVDRRMIIWFLSPLVLGLLGLFGWFSMQGNLSDALYWSVWFPLIDERTVSNFTLSPSFRDAVMFLPLLMLTFLGIFQEKKDRWFWGSILFLTLLPVFPRWSFFHLQPFVALSTVMTARFLARRSWYAFVGFLIAVMVTIPVYIQLWGREPRFFGQDHHRLAASVRREIGAESIFIFTGDQLLYPTLNILPPKPWADWFPWYYDVRSDEVERRLLAELLENPPGYVLLDTPQSGREEYRYRPPLILQLIERKYQKVKEIEGRALLLRR